MTTSSHHLAWRSHALALALALAALAVPAASHAENSCRKRNAYAQRNLVSDGAVPAEHVDPNLVNPWGIAFNPFGAVWVSDNATGLSTLYDGNGVPQSLVVSIPTPPGDTGPGNPTGIVFNGSDQFVVSSGGRSGPSRFIFASENGSISGWSPAVDLTHAILVVDNSRSGAVYKGLALAGTGTGLFLYATDFRNGKIDVFNSAFAPVTLPGAFADPSIPRGFAPFGIQNINGSLYVTYAKQDEDKEDDVAGRGLGFINVFDANGRLIKRLTSRGKLNAPWGLALAPASFGKFANRLLVGNFGDGLINVYDPVTGHWEGRLERPDGSHVRIDGLWGLSFGNGVLNQPTDTLFFTAGPEDEEHGLYGRLDLVRGNCHELAPADDEDTME
ncbi:TIGR03118 family protein [Archangium violaceum]|uniref:TIGR03118 family protein n=1 Tax=Archangium violaceum TaxID=83451 RepID=UPI001952974A|nr:TIGR03118 family protein [Archangium violaceum]QRN98787.1 TIGR03118 family protein [Archangium violaceum]